MRYVVRASPTNRLFILVQEVVKVINFLDRMADQENSQDYTPLRSARDELVEAVKSAGFKFDVERGD